MPNNFGNSYSTYFQITKTARSINDINEKISDRLIITKQGELYFDYSDSERIKITNQPESYRYNGEFGNINTEVSIPYSQLYAFDGVSLNAEGKQVIAFTMVFDNKGNMGIITNTDQITSSCKIMILTNAVTLDMVNEWTNVKRVYYPET